MMLFKERKELADKAERWMEENHVAKTALSVISFLEAMNYLNDTPSAQPDQRWIPVGERLPAMWDERYLVSLAWGGVGVMEYKSTGFHNYGSFSPVPIEAVTAWMPLPEPYAERRNDD